MVRNSVCLYKAKLSGVADQTSVSGELYDQIQKRKQMDVPDARFYAAEIVLMLQRLRQEKASTSLC